MAKKKLQIRAATINLCNATEEFFNSYESITAMGAMVLVTPNVQEMIARHQVSLNCATVFTVPTNEKVQISAFDGEYTLSPSDSIPPENTVLKVNGTLNILPGCGDILSRYLLILVNGSVFCPSSLSSAFTVISKVNGSVEIYPDNAQLIHGDLEIDRIFLLRAKANSHYYVTGKLLALDHTVTGLQEKNLQIITNRAVIREEYLESVLPVLTEKASIQVIPKGYQPVFGDQQLNCGLLLQYGDQLWIDGSLLLPPESREALEKVNQLEVSGTVTLSEELQNIFFAKCRKHGEIIYYKHLGTRIAEHPNVTITRGLLEAHPEGISINECAQVMIPHDVPAELVQQRILSISECAYLICSQEVQSLLMPVIEDVAEIRDSSDTSVFLDSPLSLNQEDQVVINTAFFSV